MLMSLQEIDSLHGSIMRLRAEEIVLGAWTDMHSAQGDVDHLKKWLDPFAAVLGEKQSKGINEFFQDFKG